MPTTDIFMKIQAVSKPPKCLSSIHPSLEANWRPIPLLFPLLITVKTEKLKLLLKFLAKDIFRMRKNI
jgi:hypothetical protein